MDPETATPAPVPQEDEAVERQNIALRIFGVFTSPGRMFASLGAKPPWGIVLLLGMVVSGACAWTYAPQAAKEQLAQAEKQGRQLTDQERDFMEGTVGKVMIATSTTLGIGLIAFVTAGIYFLVFQVLGGGAGSYRQVLSVVSHAYLIRLLAQPVSTAMILWKDSVWSQPTLRALFPGVESGTFLANFLMWTNVFELWILAVIAVGLGVVYRRSAGSCAVFVFAVYFVIAAIFAGLM